MSPEFRFLAHDGSAPAFLEWLRTRGIMGELVVEDEKEIVEFDVPAAWSGEQTEQFARLLIQRITDDACAKLTQLRAKSSSVPSSSSLTADLRRIADHFDPPPPDKVGSEYVAQRLGCTTTWIADLVRRGEIPRSCLVPGTGNGRPWKFHRAQIDRWIETR